MISTDAQSLITAADAYQILPEYIIDQIVIYILTQYATALGK